MLFSSASRTAYRGRLKGISAQRNSQNLASRGHTLGAGTRRTWDLQARQIVSGDVVTAAAARPVPPHRLIGRVASSQGTRFLRVWNRFEYLSLV